MPYADGSYITTQGAALLAKLLATSRGLVYTRVSVGSGNLPDGESPVSRKTLVTPVMDGMIYAITNPQDGEVSVQAQISSTNVPTGFYVREIALWAKDPDTGGEVLYTYVVMNTEPEWIRPKTAAVGKLATFEIISTVEAQDNVTAAINPESIARLSDINAILDRILHVTLTLDDSGGVLATFPD